MTVCTVWAVPCLGPLTAGPGRYGPFDTPMHIVVDCHFIRDVFDEHTITLPRVSTDH